MEAYKNLICDVLNEGRWVKNERTGENCLSTAGLRLQHKMIDGFPLLTVKKTPIQMMARELEGFIKGKTSKRFYQEANCTIWDPWANPVKVTESLEAMNKMAFAGLSPREKEAIRGQAARLEDDLGPIYGAQWRSFAGIDQLRSVVETLKRDPTSRRLLVSAWNPFDLPVMALPPCHFAFQLCYRGARTLDLVWYQRSADLMIGVPFNLASYALLLSLICAEVEMIPGRVTGLFGDIHIYADHMEAAQECLRREPRKLPTLALAREHGRSPLFDFYYKDAKVVGYTPHEAIPLKVAV